MPAVEDSGQGEGEDDDEDEEEEEEEGDDDEFIDVLDVLDGRGEPDLGDDGGNASRSDDKNALPHKNTRGKDIEWNGIESNGNGERSDEEDGSDEEEDEEEGEDEDVIISGDEEETDPDALEALGNFVSKLETGAKRKADDEDDNASSASQLKKKKQKILRDRTEAGKEGEFGARAAGMFSPKSKFNLLISTKVRAS